MYDDTVDAREAAKLLGIAERTLHDYVKKEWLKPLPGKGAYNRLTFRREDVLEFIEIRHNKDSWDSIATIAKQASANSRRLERLVEQLLLVIGADIPLANLDPEALISKHVEIQDTPAGPRNSAEVFELARFFLGIGEEYFELVTHYTGDREPWIPYLRLAAAVQKSRINTLHKADAETRAAYQYLDMARRRLRETAFFHVRAQHGRKYAYELFPDAKDGAHQELATLSSAIFP